MGTVLAECPVHGVVQSQSFISGDGAAIMSGNQVSCPKPGCRKLARVLDGTYTLQDSKRRATLYEPTPAARRRLETVLAWAQEALVSPEVDELKVAQALENAIEREAPRAARMLDAFRGSTSANAAAWVAVLLSLMIWLTSGNGISADDVEQIVSEQIRLALDEQSQAEPEGSNLPEEHRQTPGAPPTATTIPTPTTR